MPIGAVLVSPEISEVIHSHSNKLGKLMYDQESFLLVVVIVVVWVHLLISRVRFFCSWIYFFRAPCILCGSIGSTQDLQVRFFFCLSHWRFCKNFWTSNIQTSLSMILQGSMLLMLSTMAKDTLCPVNHLFNLIFFNLIFHKLAEVVKILR